ncbi:MAG: ABC transporter permease subunit [Pseudomonadota bacterium]
MATTVDRLPAEAQAEKGRSLWQAAWLRLRANRAAMASLVFLVIMALACLFGPWLMPHGFEAVYRDYTKVPASLSPYPKVDNVAPALEDTLRRARIEVSDIAIDDGKVTAVLTSSRPIDPRSGRYVDRSDMFSNSTVTDISSDELSANLETDVVEEYFLFGTDTNGRDLLTRTLIGGRISLMIGLLATFVALFIGVTYGAVSGYLGGKTDAVMMRIVDILYSLPFMFFVIMLVVFFGRNLILMFIAVGAIEWLDMARIVRGQTLSIKRQEYVQAAQALGVSESGILWRHVVPNTLGPVVVFMTLMVPKVILLESFLSFLGLGVQEPMTSWGVLIAEGANNIQGAPGLLIFPSLFLATTLFALNFLGDGLRDALDPKDR